MVSERHPLWIPDAVDASRCALQSFRNDFATQLGADLTTYADLHHASLYHREDFWSLIWDRSGIIGQKGKHVLIDDTMPGARFFPDAKLNYAENLLVGDDDRIALIFRAENQVHKQMTLGELRNFVSQSQQWLIAQGVKPGDRVAAMLPNMPEAIGLMLATASIGAIWSSCSPDFGPRGVLDRFGQIEPKIFIACDGYFYNGKWISLRDKLAAIVPELPTVTQVLLVSMTDKVDKMKLDIAHAVYCDQTIAKLPAKVLEFTRLPFNHPLFILFSSGTTGIPKCIVHGAGGTLLQHAKEHRLHCNIGKGDRVFYFTTLGWMMWNWLVSALACEATLVLYDGSPFSPDPSVLFDFAEQERVNFFGTSAKYIDSCRKAGLDPARSHQLGSLRVIASTGSPLSDESFHYVYDHIKSDVHLASISGGTDIVSCFVLGNPAQPVYAGEIQCAGLGMAVDVWDDAGRPLPIGKGELVCTKAFPSMPVAFWNDPDGKKYRAAYFERFAGVWHHGDFAERTVHDGFIIHGRSDATLNPGGVRIGTAEIYAQVERIPEVIEALAIGQDFQNDVRIILFVRLAEGVALDGALDATIRRVIRDGASPRHVPAKIIAVSDIPRTKSGKITELAVRDMVHGRDVKNREALANPDALELYRNIAALAEP